MTNLELKKWDGDKRNYDWQPVLYSGFSLKSFLTFKKSLSKEDRQGIFYNDIKMHEALQFTKLSATPCDLNECVKEGVLKLLGWANFGDGEGIHYAEWKLLENRLEVQKEDDDDTVEYYIYN